MALVEPITEYVITDHAAFEMERREISLSVLDEVMRRPEQRFSVRAGRNVLQSRMQMDDKSYLVRVFVDVDRLTPEVVTVYRTTKVNKYWRTENEGNV